MKRLLFVLPLLSMLLPVHAQDKQALAKSDSLFARGVALYKAGQYEKAIPLFVESDRIDKAELDSTSNRRDYSSMWLASCYYRIGDMAKAEETNDYYDVEPVDRRLTVESDSLSALGTEYYHSDDYEQALSCFLQCAEIEKTVVGDNHICYANTLDACAQIYDMLLMYEEAIRLKTEVLNIFEQVFGKNYPNYVALLNNLASYNSSLGNYSEVIRLGTESLNILEQISEKDSGEYAATLTFLGGAYSMLGYYSKAMQLGAKTVEIFRKIYGELHPFYATSLDFLARYNFGLGNYTKAIRLETEVLNIREQVLGKSHSDYASSLNLLANCYSLLGNYSEAIRIGTEALNIREQILSKSHPDYGASLVNLAENYSYLGNYSEAVRLVTEALNILEQVYGKSHLVYATSLNNLANYNSSLGNYPEAIRLGTEVLNIREQVYGKSHPDYATSLHNLASYNSSLGNYSEAIRLGTEALNIRRQFLGKSHSDYVLSLSTLAGYNAALGNHLEVFHLATEATSLVSQIVRNTFADLTAHERNLFWNKYKYWFEKRIHDFAFDFPIDSLYSNGYNGILLSKGLLLNCEISFATLLAEAGDKEVAKLYDELKILRLQIERQREKPIRERIMNVDSMQTVAKSMERTLIERSKEYGDYTRNLVINWEQVQETLEEKEIAIEFASFPTGKDSTMYIAYCLHKDSPTPKMIPLFEEKQLGRISKLDYYTTNALTDLVWKPLAVELQDVRNVYFAPDGELYNIAIESLPAWEGGGLMSDKRNFYRLSSTRELALAKDKNKIKTAAVYGGLRYDADEQVLIADNKKYPAKRDLEVFPIADSLNLRSGVQELPATKMEAIGIDSALVKVKVANKLYVDTLGTEASFKALSGQKHNLLHIATHGFYWTEREAQSMDHLGFLSFGNGNLPRYVEDKAMTRSGLLFAGANHALMGKPLPEGVDDGILTAKEISALDLRGLDMVVLSACQTGLGEITGDGVFGLQRGFKKAGANTLLMSLWKVDDKATRMLMTQFYANLTAGKSKFDSLREAQRYVREYEVEVAESDSRTAYQRYKSERNNGEEESLRPEPTIRKVKPYASPKYWAAFILLDAVN